MSRIGGLIFSTTGILTKRGIMKRATQIGKEAAAVISKEKTISQEQLNEIVQRNLGKHSKKVTYVTEKKDTINILMNEQKLSKEEAERYYNSTLACAIPKFGGKGVVVNIRPNAVENKYLANTIGHELEHAMFNSYSIRGKIINNILHLFSKSKLEKIAQKNRLIHSKIDILEKELINGLGHFGSSAGGGLTENPATLEGLLKQCGVETHKKLQKCIKIILFSRGILVPGKFKENAEIALAAKTIFKDEARAYQIGGKCEQEFYKLLGIETGCNVTKSEMNSILYKETIKVLESEFKRANKNRLKAFLGLKTDANKEQTFVNWFNQRSAMLEKLTQEIIDEYKTKGTELTQGKLIELLKERLG